MKRMNPAEAAIREKIAQLVAEGQPGQRLPRIRDLMIEFKTSQRVVQRALAPLIESGQVQARSGAGVLILGQEPETKRYLADCLILYRNSESRLARTLLIELVARLRRKGYRVNLQGFDDDARALENFKEQDRYRCCLLQSNFEIVSVELLARIKSCADALVIDGTSVTGIDADVIGTNWREALAVGFRQLRAQGHERIGFLTSAHDARQIAMARREFLLLSDWHGPDPHPGLHKVPRLPGSYQRNELIRALPPKGCSDDATTALIVWGLVDGSLMDAALSERQLRLGVDVSVVLLGSVDVPSEHVRRFDVVGNSDAEKLALFENVITARIEGEKSAPRTYYLPIYLQENGSIQRINATFEG